MMTGVDATIMRSLRSSKHTKQTQSTTSKRRTESDKQTQEATNKTEQGSTKTSRNTTNTGTVSKIKLLQLRENERQKYDTVECKRSKLRLRKLMRPVTDSTPRYATLTSRGVRRVRRGKGLPTPEPACAGQVHGAVVLRLADTTWLIAKFACPR